jgi:hypothetical protein
MPEPLLEPCFSGQCHTCRYLLASIVTAVDARLEKYCHPISRAPLAESFTLDSPSTPAPLLERNFALGEAKKLHELFAQLAAAPTINHVRNVAPRLSDHASIARRGKTFRCDAAPNFHDS